MYLKLEKIRLRKKCYKFVTNEEITKKNAYYDFKACIYVILKFQVRFF